MDTGIAIAGLLVLILGPFTAIAYRSKSRWPTFRDKASRLLLCVGGATGFMGVGMGWAMFLPQFSVPVFGALGWVCAAALLAVLLIVFADWARDE